MFAKKFKLIRLNLCHAIFFQLRFFINLPLEIKKRERVTVFEKFHYGSATASLVNTEHAPKLKNKKFFGEVDSKC